MLTLSLPKGEQSRAVAPNSVETAIRPTVILRCAQQLYSTKSVFKRFGVLYFATEFVYE